MLLIISSGPSHRELKWEELLQSVEIHSAVFQYFFILSIYTSHISAAFYSYWSYVCVIEQITGYILMDAAVHTSFITDHLSLTLCIQNDFYMCNLFFPTKCMTEINVY